MIEIRFHGRGGQGAVIASEILAAALFREGKSVQAFPSFGVERRGAPVAAFLRIDSSPIRLRCQIESPDHVIVLDPTLVKSVDVAAGLKPGGWLLLNSQRDPDRFRSQFGDLCRIACVDANSIAARWKLGERTRPIVNTAILGAFARISGLVGLEAVLEAIAEGVPVQPDDNMAAAREAFESVAELEPVGVEG